MTTINKITFQGAKALELITPALRLVAIYQFGPRIAFFGQPKGANLFLWKPGKYKRGNWHLQGGHRVWVTRPGADENEDTYATDNAPCDVEIFADGFRLIGAENPVNRTRRGFSVKVRDADTLDVDNFVQNTGDMLYSGGLWVLTCTVPGKGTRYGIPLGDGSEWNAYRMVHFNRWGGHGQGGFNDKQIVTGKDLLVINPVGIENKRMVESHHGIIAMSDPSRDVTFAKKVPHDISAACPLGCNVEMDETAREIGPKNFMVELETMGAERTLRPGDTLHHTEKWILKPGAVKLTNAASLLQLFA